MTSPLPETLRLGLRRIDDTDLDALHAVYGDAEAMRWVGDGRPLDRAQCARWIALTRANHARRGYGMFAVVARGQDRPLGFCGLVHPGGQPLPELKYALHRSAWGRGLATEAAAALLGYGATAHGLRHVVATVAAANTASRRVLEKIGMRRTTTRREADGSDTLVFAWRLPA
ncbi:MAG: GNAT family N-acetyltransferase [Rehaibacterium terrae]|uniref:GNAT family N-acetyltransferase n=1 Tax=Rehaibacterium terrae TaxID=1341696 RepID=UPI00391B0971